MLQTPQTNLVMDKSPSVDREVSLRNLGDKKSFGLGMIFSRPESDINRGVAVSVSLIPAFSTFEDRTIPYALSSTFRADVRGSSWMDCDDKPAILPCHRLERRSEPAVWHAFSFAVTLPIGSGVLQPFEVFYGYEGVVSFSQLDDFMGNLPATGSIVVAFTFSESSRCLSRIPASSVSIASQYATPKAEVSLSISNILTKVELPQNFAFTVDYGYCCQPFNSNINADNRLIVSLDWKLLLENYVDSVLVKPKESCPVPFFQQLFISLVSPIHSDWNGNSAIKSYEADYRVAFSGRCKVSTPWDVEGNCNVAYFSAVVQYGCSILEQVVGDLAVQPKLSDLLVKEPLKFRLRCFDALSYNKRECLSIDTLEVFNSSEFGFGGLNKVQRYSFNDFHPKTKNKSFTILYKSFRIPPRLKHVGFLR